MIRRLIVLSFIAVTVVLVAFRFRRTLLAIVLPDVYTVSERVKQCGPQVKERLSPHFAKIGIHYPPAYVWLVCLKNEKTLEVWVSDKSNKPVHLKDYPILGASGRRGPKLQSGDLQVPEGFYQIQSLNPNSRYHLALKINYPNQYDLEKAQKDDRKDLGGDIMIHGSSGSIGCLAMGDQASEDLFVLVAQTGIKNVSVILSPLDFRVHKGSTDTNTHPEWTKELYDKLKQELCKFIKPDNIVVH